MVQSIMYIMHVKSLVVLKPPTAADQKMTSAKGIICFFVVCFVFLSAALRIRVAHSSCAFELRIRVAHSCSLNTFSFFRVFAHVCSLNTSFASLRVFFDLSYSFRVCFGSRS